MMALIAFLLILPLAQAKESDPIPRNAEKVSVRGVLRRSEVGGGAWTIKAGGATYDLHGKINARDGTRVRVKGFIGKGTACFHGLGPILYVKDIEAVKSHRLHRERRSGFESRGDRFCFEILETLDAGGKDPNFSPTYYFEPRHIVYLWLIPPQNRRHGFSISTSQEGNRIEVSIHEDTAGHLSVLLPSKEGDYDLVFSTGGGWHDHYRLSISRHVMKLEPINLQFTEAASLAFPRMQYNSFRFDCFSRNSNKDLCEDFLSHVPHTGDLEELKGREYRQEETSALRPDQVSKYFRYRNSNEFETFLDTLEDYAENQKRRTFWAEITNWDQATVQFSTFDP